MCGEDDPGRTGCERGAKHRAEIVRIGHAIECDEQRDRLRAPGGWVLVSLAADVDRAFRFSPPVRVEAVEGIELF